MFQQLISTLLLLLFCSALFTSTPAVAGQGRALKKYVRFQAGTTIAHGIVEGDRVRQIKGDLFGAYEATNTTYPLESLKLLAPVKPTQVIAMAGNYRSHLAGEEISAKFKIPQAFFKSASCVIGTGENIVIPRDAEDVHFEGELVIVIGREARDVPEEQALDYVFGVTCGNDVSERKWQKSDVQWWRAKGSDTFGPIGPVIVSGINYDDLQLTLRANGEVKQQQRTSDLIHSVPATVSFISRYVTLHQGDLIFTGTPGTTSAIKPGDTIEVEIEGVGTLTNGVVAEK